MTVEQLAEALKPVIEDVVRKVVQSEIREILTEAVEIASRPGESGDSFEIEEPHTPAAPAAPRAPLPKPAWVRELEEKEQDKSTKSPVQESKRPARIGSGMTQEEHDKQQNAIMGLLGATARGMTAEDLSNFA